MSLSEKDVVKSIRENVLVTVRVATSDSEMQTIKMLMQCNHKVAEIVQEIADLTGENKWKLQICKDGRTLAFSDSIAEKGLHEVLCIKGGDGPKSFMRFMHMD